MNYDSWKANEPDPNAHEARPTEAEPAKVERTYPAHELALRNRFVVFVVEGDAVHVSEWFGYDIERARCMTREGARARWRQLLKDGYALARDFDVKAGYLGFDRSATAGGVR